MALKRVWIPTPNYSSRGGATVRLICVHTAEGARTYQNLGSFFQGNVQASSHVGIDDTPGVIGEYTKRDKKSWTQMGYNPVAVSVELCAFARWSAADWAQHPNMLANVAAWIAEEAAAFAIPVVKLTPAQAQGGAAGVCGHVDLGQGGGGHWDPGPAFPWSQVLAQASQGATPAPAPAAAPKPSYQGDDMIIKEANGDVFWAIYDGPNTKWRPVPKAAADNLKPEQVTDDKDGALLGMWAKTG